MDTLRTTLQGKALKECWVCGDNRWSMPPGTNMIPAGAGTDGEIDFTLGISVVAVICKTCGLVRLHHEGRLLEMGHDDALR